MDAAQPETWTRAFMATGIICITLLVLIHPMRKEFDADRNPGYPVRFSDGLRNIGMVVRNPKLRDLAIAMYAFVGLQGLFNAIFTTYAQTSLGFEKDIALKILLAVNLISALSRILWGWIGSTVMSARLVLSLLAFIMAASSFAVGHAQGWPLEWLAFAAFAFGASALSWHGLLLSEVATLSPPGMVGPVTGGVLFWGALGMFTYPLFAKTLRDFGVSYEVIFSVAALPAIMIGIKLLWPAERATHSAKAPTPLEAPTPRRANRIYSSTNVVE
ncbi:MAG: MFS transporter, partial [Alphaproteobacteria bacterium]